MYRHGMYDVLVDKVNSNVRKSGKCTMSTFHETKKSQLSRNTSSKTIRVIVRIISHWYGLVWSEIVHSVHLACKPPYLSLIKRNIFKTMCVICRWCRKRKVLLPWHYLWQVFDCSKQHCARSVPVMFPLYCFLQKETLRIVLNYQANRCKRVKSAGKILDK